MFKRYKLRKTKERPLAEVYS